MNFIIGSTGFLTNSLIRDLPKLFNQESLLSFRKFSNKQIIDKISQKKNDELSNLLIAAWPTDFDYDSFEHIKFFKDKIKPFLIELAKSDIQNLRVITFGTCLEYGLFEGPINENKLACPCTKLGTAKLMMFDLCRNLFKKNNYIHLRIFYPYSHDMPREGSFLYHLEEAIKNKKLDFDMSIGEQERDFFETNLLSKYIQKIIKKDIWDIELLNIGSCKPKKVIDLANQHLAITESFIKFNKGIYQIPWYEPFSFYSDHTKKVNLFLNE